MSESSPPLGTGGESEPPPTAPPGGQPEPPLPAPPATGKPDLRASDAEREQALDALRTAAGEGRLNVDELEERTRAAYTVVTRRELEALIADVTVVPLGATRPASAASTSGVTVREGPGGTHWIVSIMGGDDRRGRWRIGSRCNVINVMGGSDIDLNDAELSAQVTQINVYSVMGGGTVRVPDGVDVQVSKFAVMGGNDVRLGDQIPPPGGPLIRVRLVSIMGGSSVKRGRRRSERERGLGKGDGQQIEPARDDEREG